MNFKKKSRELEVSVVKWNSEGVEIRRSVRTVGHKTLVSEKRIVFRDVD